MKFSLTLGDLNKDLTLANAINASLIQTSHSADPTQHWLIKLRDEVISSLRVNMSVSIKTSQVQGQLTLKKVNWWCKIKLHIMCRMSSHICVKYSNIYRILSWCVEIENTKMSRYFNGENTVVKNKLLF